MCGYDACNAKGVVANRFLAYFSHLAPFDENCSQVGCIGFPGWQLNRNSFGWQDVQGNPITGLGGLLFGGSRFFGFPLLFFLGDPCRMRFGIETFHEPDLPDVKTDFEAGIAVGRNCLRGFGQAKDTNRSGVVLRSEWNKSDMRCRFVVLAQVKSLQGYGSVPKQKTICKMDSTCACVWPLLRRLF
jgi:hypothetical protein